jgi:hypothetical protein
MAPGMLTAEVISVRKFDPYEIRVLAIVQIM